VSVVRALSQSTIVPAKASITTVLLGAAPFARYPGVLGHGELIGPPRQICRVASSGSSRSNRIRGRGAHAPHATHTPRTLGAHEPLDSAASHGDATTPRAGPHRGCSVGGTLVDDGPVASGLSRPHSASVMVVSRRLRARRPGAELCRRSPGAISMPCVRHGGTVRSDLTTSACAVMHSRDHRCRGSLSRAKTVIAASAIVRSSAVRSCA